METINKRKRVRKRPQKKWSQEELRSLLEFLLENGDIEKPTAQFYYTKCLEQTGLDTTSDILRCKVRYWRHQFHKAEEYRKSLEDDIDAIECATIKKKLNKICPFYDQLIELFGNKNGQIIEYNYYSSETECNASMDPIDDTTVFMSPQFEETVSAEIADAEPKFFTVQSRASGQKRKTPMSKKSFVDDAEASRNAYYQERLRIEQEKLELERTKAMQEFQLRKMELAQKEKLAEMELAQKERLAEMELRFKYNKE